MDIEYLLWLQSIREAAGPAIEMIMNVITFLGSSATLAVVPCILYWIVDKELGLFILTNIGIGNNINQLVKDTACVYRPWIRDTRIAPSRMAMGHATGYSFPSGHTQGSASVYGSLAWRIRERHPQAILLAILVLLIAFSRNFLGVHTPQDVLVALCISALAIWLSGLFISWVKRDTTKDTTVLAVGLAAIAAIVVYTTVKPYPMDYVGGVLLVDPAEMRLDAYSTAGVAAGTLVGWFLEHRYVRFSTDCSAKRKAIRLVVGLLTVALFLGLAQLIKFTLGNGIAYAVAKGLFAAFSGVFTGPAIARYFEDRFDPSGTGSRRESA